MINFHIGYVFNFVILIGLGANALDIQYTGISKTDYECMIEAELVVNG